MHEGTRIPTRVEVKASPLVTTLLRHRAAGFHQTNVETTQEEQNNAFHNESENDCHAAQL